jgi:hypothetical protein
MSPRFNLGAKSVRCRLKRSKVSERCVSTAYLFAGYDYYTGAFADRSFKMDTVNAVSKHQLGYNWLSSTGSFPSTLTAR